MSAMVEVQARETAVGSPIYDKKYERKGASDVAVTEKVRESSWGKTR